MSAVAGVDREGWRVLWLANLTGQKQETVLEGTGTVHSAWLVDEQSFTGLASDPWKKRKILSAQPVQLLPYAVACLKF